MCRLIKFAMVISSSTHTENFASSTEQNKFQVIKDVCSAFAFHAEREAKICFPSDSKLSPTGVNC